MRTGLIALGIIFLVIGGLLYLVPHPSAEATVIGDNYRTWYASLYIPREITYAILIIGAVLFLLGLLIPGSRSIVVHEHDSPAVVREREHVEGVGSKRKIFRERKEEYHEH